MSYPSSPSEVHFGDRRCWKRQQHLESIRKCSYHVFEQEWDSTCCVICSGIRFHVWDLVVLNSPDITTELNHLQECS